MALSGAFGSARFRVLKVVLEVLKRRPKRSHARPSPGVSVVASCVCVLEFRFLHATAASCVFLCLFLHILRVIGCDVGALAMSAGGVVTGRGGKRV